MELAFAQIEREGLSVVQCAEVFVFSHGDSDLQWWSALASDMEYAPSGHNVGLARKQDSSMTSHGAINMHVAELDEYWRLLGPRRQVCPRLLDWRIERSVRDEVEANGRLARFRQQVDAL